MTDLAEPGPGITFEELQLATRNRGMPLEGLRYGLTPTGMHYLLVHFDIPALDPKSWGLEVGGNVRVPTTLTLDEVRSRPVRTIPVTMECVGNGRARLEPRPLSQPWLVEAIGTAEWTGTSLAGLLEEVGIEPGTVEIVFTGADRGVQREVEHDYARSLPLAEATRPEVLLVYEMNGRPLEPQHGFPLRLIVPGWYGMTNVKWLTRLHEPAPGEEIRDPRRDHQRAYTGPAHRPATDADGDVQPEKQPWNQQGMGNNLVQEVAITVR